MNKKMLYMMGLFGFLLAGEICGMCAHDEKLRLLELESVERDNRLEELEVSIYFFEKILQDLSFTLDEIKKKAEDLYRRYPDDLSEIPDKVFVLIYNFLPFGCCLKMRKVSRRFAELFCSFLNTLWKMYPRDVGVKIISENINCNKENSEECLWFCKFCLWKLMGRIVEAKLPRRLKLFASSDSYKWSISLVDISMNDEFKENGFEFEFMKDLVPVVEEFVPERLEIEKRRSRAPMRKACLMDYVRHRPSKIESFVL